MSILYQSILDRLKGELPGAKAHHTMLPQGRKLNAPSSDSSTIKKSSVLLLLYPENDQIYISLIKRPAHMKYHAGQIAFPGGRIEKGETALETALRETEEEIGIQTENIKIIGSLSELYVEVSNFLIHPYVGWLDEKPKFEINKSEADKMVLFPFLQYRNSFETTTINTATGVLEVPCIKFENETIWGATAMILSEFYDLTDKLQLSLNNV
jgi:8-oxo-dGTP pyrophosphatase MutT (NUDIX family)